MAKPTKIIDDALLENSTDGDIIEAKEWNTVMSNIKAAINNHADVLNETKPPVHLINIPANAWRSPANTSPNITRAPYYYNIVREDFALPETYMLVAFNEYNEQVLIQSELDDTKALIRLRSRKRVPLKVLIQGVVGQ